MSYTDDYNKLKSAIDFTDDFIDGDAVDAVNPHYHSPYYDILPGASSYHCRMHQFTSDYCYPFDTSAGIVNEVLDVYDSWVEENKQFSYHIFLPKGLHRTNKIVLMLHGFNEKSWTKYYAWAKRIVEPTGKAAVLFPIAFHMNRAPAAWSETRGMFAASAQQKKLYPFILHSSLSNVAISTRLHAKPQRFVWSGLQTYYDVIQLIDQIKSGDHPITDASASINLFAYSIGAFLSEVLMITNHNKYFGNSKLSMFCGGPVFNRISPVSKFILGSEANVHLYSFLIERLDSYLNKDNRLAHYLSEQHPEGMYFSSILNYSAMAGFREKRLKEIAGQLYALALNGDTVIYPYEALNTLQGKYRDIPVQVDILDLPYEFIHETAFPVGTKHDGEVKQAFDKVFDLLGKQLM